MEEKAIRGVPWTLLSYALNKGVSLLATLVLARLVAPADFGLMAIALMAVNFLYWFGGLSFGGTLILRQDLDRREQGTVLTVALAGSTLAALVAVALSPLAALAFDEPQLTGVLAVMSVAVVLTGITAFYESLLQRELEFRRRFVGLVCQTATYAAVSVTLAVLGAGVWSLVAGQIASLVAFAGVLLALAPYRVTPRFDRATARSALATSRGFLTQGVTVFVRQNVDTVAVGAAFGARALGFYSMAYRLGDLTYWAVADPVARVTFPAFARARHRGEDIRPAFLSVIRLVSLVACPAGILLSAAADPLVRVVFGETWLPMIGPIMVIGLWAALRPIETTLSWLLNSIERAGVVGWVSAIILIPLVPGLVVATAIGTITVVALVPLLDTALSLGIVAVLARRYLDLPLRDQWRALRPIVLAAPVAWGATFGVQEALSGQADVLRLAACLLAGIAAYVASVALVEPGLAGRTAQQLGRMLGRRPSASAAGG